MPTQTEAVDFMDRRREKRYHRALSVDLFGDRNELLGENLTLQDISTRGFQFETVIAHFKPGDIFRFQMEIPEKGKIAGNAKVCWCRSCDTGVFCHCGAEIRSMGWGNVGALRGYLEPVTLDMRRTLILTLKALGWMLFFLLAQSAWQRDLFLYEQYLLKADSAWFPAILAGIGFLISGLLYCNIDLYIWPP